MRTLIPLEEELEEVQRLNTLYDEGVRRILLLDFDGVLNTPPGVRFGPNTFRPDVKFPFPNPYHESGTDDLGPSRYWIRSSSELIEKISDIALAEDVQIIWLTTWRQFSGGLARTLGLHGSRPQFYLPWGADDFHLAEHFNHFRKVDAAAEWLCSGVDSLLAVRDPMKVVWVDDILFDLRTGDLDAGNLVSALAPAVLGIGPDTRYGISRDQMSHITEFLKKVPSLSEGSTGRC